MYGLPNVLSRDFDAQDCQKADRHHNTQEILQSYNDRGSSQ